MTSSTGAIDAGAVERARRIALEVLFGPSPPQDAELLHEDGPWRVSAESIAKAFASHLAALSPTPASETSDLAERLARFARHMISQYAWGGHEGGDDVQELALKLGLIVPVPGGYDPEKHGESEYDAEPGDDWFEFAPALRKGTESHG